MEPNIIVILQYDSSGFLLDIVFIFMNRLANVRRRALERNFLIPIVFLMIVDNVGENIAQRLRHGHNLLVIIIITNRSSLPCSW